MTKIISLDARRRQNAEQRVDALCAAVESDFVSGPMLDARHVDGSIGLKVGALEVWETPAEAELYAMRILKAVAETKGNNEQ